MLQDSLIRHEGIKLKPYRDTVGNLTIGVGRNLDDVGISSQEAMHLLDNDIRRVQSEVDKVLPWIRLLDDARRDVLYEMAFQLGVNGLLGFKNTLLAVREGQYQKAAEGMRNSKWHSQTPARCEELAKIMENG